CTSIRGRVGGLAAGACAAAGTALVIVAAAPRPTPSPRAATPPARKLRRAGLAGRADGSQHRQLRTSFRLMDLGVIPSPHALSLSGWKHGWEGELSRCGGRVPGFGKFTC